MEIVINNGDELISFIEANKRLSFKQSVEIVQAFAGKSIYYGGSESKEHVISFLKTWKRELLTGELPLFIN